MILRHRPSGVLFPCCFAAHGENRPPVLVRDVDEIVIRPDELTAFEIYSCSPQERINLARYRGLNERAPA